MTIGDIRSQEVQVTETGGPQAAVAPYSADTSDAAVPCLKVAVPHLCRQQQLFPLQFMD
jgi:hypothetical protein